MYSSRHYNTDKALYAAFTKATGIKVNLLEAKDKVLLQRLQSEGDNTPADVLVLADAARLVKAANMDLLQPSSSQQLNQAVPKNLRDGEGRWYALTRRARVPIVNPAKVDPSRINSYADLADPGQLADDMDHRGGGDLGLAELATTEQALFAEVFRPLDPRAVEDA